MSTLEDNRAKGPPTREHSRLPRHSLDPLHELIEARSEIPAYRKGPCVEILGGTVGLTWMSTHTIDQHPTDLPQLGV